HFKGSSDGVCQGMHYIKNKSLQKAISSTRLSRLRAVGIAKRALPKWAPIKPPAAAAQNQSANELSRCKEPLLPNKPLKEFKVMKMVEVAAASLALAQPNRI